LVWQKIERRFFLDHPPEILKVIYTTNAIESLNFSLRKLLKSWGAFPTDESILKVLYLGMQRFDKKWTMSIPDWKRALNQFAILLGDRVPTRK
jgi:transposase-like protein